ncbi:hypothetical protein LguiA_001588 [Lonicera macranthoides]
MRVREMASVKSSGCESSSECERYGERNDGEEGGERNDSGKEGGKRNALLSLSDVKECIESIFGQIMENESSAVTDLKVNMVINMYSKYGLVGYACKVFDGMLEMVVAENMDVLECACEFFSRSEAGTNELRIALAETKQMITWFEGDLSKPDPDKWNPDPLVKCMVLAIVRKWAEKKSQTCTYSIAHQQTSEAAVVANGAFHWVMNDLGYEHFSVYLTIGYFDLADEKVKGLRLSASLELPSEDRHFLGVLDGCLCVVANDPVIIQINAISGELSDIEIIQILSLGKVGENGARNQVSFSSTILNSMPPSTNHLSQHAASTLDGEASLRFITFLIDHKDLQKTYNEFIEFYRERNIKESQQEGWSDSEKFRPNIYEEREDADFGLAKKAGVKENGYELRELLRISAESNCGNSQTRGLLHSWHASCIGGGVFYKTACLKLCELLLCEE